MDETETEGAPLPHPPHDPRPCARDADGNVIDGPPGPAAPLPPAPPAANEEE